MCQKLIKVHAVKSQICISILPLPFADCVTLLNICLALLSLSFLSFTVEDMVSNSWNFEKLKCTNVWKVIAEIWHRKAAEDSTSLFIPC